MRHVTSTLLLALGAVAMAVPACDQGDPTQPPTSFSDAKSRAATSGKLLLVDFYATW